MKERKYLFDHGSHLWFDSEYFAYHLGIQPRPLHYVLYVNTIIGDSLITNLNLVLLSDFIGELELFADLVLLKIWSFDIILSMDWLSSYHTSMDCYITNDHFLHIWSADLLFWEYWTLFISLPNVSQDDLFGLPPNVILLLIWSLGQSQYLSLSTERYYLSKWNWKSNYEGY